MRACLINAFVLNKCGRGERPDRCLMAETGRGASGRGRCATKPHRRQGAHRAPQQEELADIGFPHIVAVYNLINAGVVELADTLDLGSNG